MKWKTHLAIGEWIGRTLNFDKENLINFTNGIIAPDKRKFRFYHHNDELLKIIINRKIIKTRQLFLKENKKYFYELGVLLHYIQDRFIKTTSYLEHIDIEEELEKLSKLKKEKDTPRIRKHVDTIKERIENLDIKEEDKNLLLDPSWTKGFTNTLKLAFVILPQNIDNKLLLNIVYRVSFGVVKSILDKGPPTLLLQEEINIINKQIKNKIKKFIFYLLILEFFVFIIGIIFPIIMVGSIFSLFIGGINLFIILPILLSHSRIKNYIKMKEWAISLGILFLFIVMAVSLFLYFNHNTELKNQILTILLFVVGITYIFYPRVHINKEIKNEIKWY